MDHHWLLKISLLSMGACTMAFLITKPTFALFDLPVFAFGTAMTLLGATDLHQRLFPPPPPIPIVDDNGVGQIGVPREEGDDDDALDGQIILHHANINALLFFQGACVLDGWGMLQIPAPLDSRFRALRNFRHDALRGRSCHPINFMNSGPLLSAEDLLHSTNKTTFVAEAAHGNDYKRLALLNSVKRAKATKRNSRQNSISAPFKPNLLLEETEVDNKQVLGYTETNANRRYYAEPATDANENEALSRDKVIEDEHAEQDETQIIENNVWMEMGTEIVKDEASEQAQTVIA